DFCPECRVAAGCGSCSHVIVCDSTGSRRKNKGKDSNDANLLALEECKAARAKLFQVCDTCDLEICPLCVRSCPRCPEVYCYDCFRVRHSRRCTTDPDHD